MISRESRGRRAAALPAAVAAAFFLVSNIVGCGPPSPYVKVQGTVTLDGAPLRSGVVQFHPPAGQVAAGEIGPGGEFRLSTRSPGDGVLPGTYQATVTAWNGDSPEHSALPLRYARAGSSGLQVTIFPDSTAPVKLELVSDEGAADAARAGGSPTGAGAAGSSPAGEAGAAVDANTGGADRGESRSPSVD